MGQVKSHKSIQLPDGRRVAVVPWLEVLRLPLAPLVSYCAEPTDSVPTIECIEFRWRGKRTADGVELWDQI